MFYAFQYMFTFRFSALQYFLWGCMIGASTIRSRETIHKGVFLLLMSGFWVQNFGASSVCG